MRKFIAAAAFAGTTVMLAACAEQAVEEPVEEVVDSADAVDGADEASGVLDANSATAEALAGVEGVSAELAEAIVAGQPYENITALNAKLTETLSAEEAAAVLVNVFVPINLNSASRDEINLVPGMTDKMAHEFEEYRPYADMDQFDREIGKYVDEDEVARFRQYVTL